MDPSGRKACYAGYVVATLMIAVMTCAVVVQMVYRRKDNASVKDAGMKNGVIQSCIGIYFLSIIPLVVCAMQTYKAGYGSPIKA